MAQLQARISKSLHSACSYISRRISKGSSKKFGWLVEWTSILVSWSVRQGPWVVSLELQPLYEVGSLAQAYTFIHGCLSTTKKSVSGPSGQCRLTLQRIEQGEANGADAAGNRLVGDLVLPSTARYSRGRPLASCFSYPSQVMAASHCDVHDTTTIVHPKTLWIPLSADLFT